MIVFLELLFKIVGYSLFLYGLWGLVGVPFLADIIDVQMKNVKRKRAIKRLDEFKNTKEEVVKQNKLIEHLDLTISSILRKHSKRNTINFIFLTVTVFVISFSFLNIFLKDVISSIILATIFGMFPYLLLRFILANLRMKTSQYFYEMANILLQNYQVSNKDIYYTIFNTSKEIENVQMKKVLMRLLSAIQKDRSKTEFKKATRVFAYTINSIPAKRFAKLIEKAHLENADITLSLRGLQEDIKQRKKDMKKESTENLETVFMGFLPLATLPICFYMMLQFSSGRDIWYYFFQEKPFTLFILSVVGAVISAMFAFLLYKPKTDV